MTGINIKTRNIPEIKQKISDLPRGVRGKATEAAAFALIGNERTGLQHYPNRKEHGKNNPYQWQSDKQRRAYFATKGFGGGIPYSRTYRLRFGWQATNWGDGTAMKIQNKTPYASFVQGNDIQKGHVKDGWRVFTDIISTNINAMNRAIDLAVKRYLKEKGW